MKKKLLFPVMLAGVIAFACDSEDDSVRDLEAPTITFAENRDTFRPVMNEIRSRATDHMHIRFSVQDESGIQQVRIDIHGGFDGHTHGRVSGAFEQLLVNDIIEVDGARFYNHDDSSLDVYWEGNDPRNRIETNVLAGPYHISIDATDIFGNATSHANGTTISKTFFIERPYAPEFLIDNAVNGAFTATSGQPLNVEGKVEVTNHPLSSELAFFWARVSTENSDDEDLVLAGNDIYERMWGRSMYRVDNNGDRFRGPALPSTSMLDLTTLFTGDAAINVPSGSENLWLILWVEDTAGNVTRRAFRINR
ncbi:DUF4625 domain-containing protein [Nitritalea halalkaliphila]|nr:DUF4625 domain-containing protein [Nitritalea halalkaliphila]